jgi:hypothetical protein
LRGAVGIVFGLAVACGGHLPHPPYIPQPTEALVAVPTLPPPARVEYVPPRPKVAGAVWLDGEWTERRGRWAWKLGRWVVPPPESRFSPSVFVRAPSGNAYYAAGTFRDASGKPMLEPAPLAVAKADSVAVVDPDGLPALTGRTLRPSEATAPPK